MGRGSCEGYWWGHGVRSIVEEMGERIGGAVMTGGGKKIICNKIVYKPPSSDQPPPSIRPYTSKVMKSKLQYSTAKNKPLLFALGAH